MAEEDINKLRVLYDAASTKYRNLGTFDEFTEKMRDDKKRKIFYDAASTKYRNLGTFDEFTKKIQPYLGSDPAQEQPTEQTAEQPTTAVQNIEQPLPTEQQPNMREILSNPPANTEEDYLLRKLNGTETPADGMRDFIAEGAKYEPLNEQQKKEALARIDKSIADEKYDNRFAWRTEKDEDGNLKAYRTGDNTPKDSYGKDLFESFMAGVGDLALTPKKTINALEEAIYDNGVGRAIPFFKGARPLGMLVNGFYDGYSMLLGSDFEKRVEHYKKESDRYQEQKGIIDYLAEGEYGKAAGTAGVEAARNLPQLVTAYLGSFFTKGMTASNAFSGFLASGAAADKYEEIKNDDRLSATEKGVAVIGTFCAEFFGEKLSNDTWFKLFRSEPVKAIDLLKGDVVKAAKSFAKKAIGWGWRIACEPTGEGFTELAEQSIDYALGLSDGIDLRQVGDAAIVGGLVGGGGNLVTASVERIGTQKQKRNLAALDDMLGVSQQLGVTHQELENVALKAYRGDEMTESEQKLYDEWQRLLKDDGYVKTVMNAHGALQALNAIGDENTRGFFGELSKSLSEKGITVDELSEVLNDPNNPNYEWANSTMRSLDEKYDIFKRMQIVKGYLQKKDITEGQLHSLLRDAYNGNSKSAKELLSDIQSYVAHELAKQQGAKAEQQPAAAEQSQEQTTQEQSQEQPAEQEQTAPEQQQQPTTEQTATEQTAAQPAAEQQQQAEQKQEQPTPIGAEQRNNEAVFQPETKKVIFRYKTQDGRSLSLPLTSRGGFYVRPDGTVDWERTRFEHPVYWKPSTGTELFAPFYHDHLDQMLDADCVTVARHNADLRAEQQRAEQEAAAKAQAEAQAKQQQQAIAEQQAAQQPRYPTKKDGTPDYDKMTPQQEYDYTVENYGEEVAQKSAQAYVNKYQSAVDNIQAQLDSGKGTNSNIAMLDRLNENKERLEAWRAFVKEQQQETQPQAEQTQQTEQAQQAPQAPQARQQQEQTQQPQQTQQTKQQDEYSEFSDEDVDATVDDILQQIQEQKELAAKPVSIINERAIAKRKAAKQEIERLQQLYEHWSGIKQRRAEQKQAPQAEQQEAPQAEPVQQPQPAPAAQAEPTPTPAPQAVQQENDTPREKKSAKNLESEEKSTTFAPADDENGQRLQVNITQNAGEEGSPNRMGDLNEKDRVAYKDALETLRRKDISDEQRNAAEAVMNEIEQRRKAQMEAMVAAALNGIEGVSDVTTNAGIGVYMGEKGEVVEYTFTIDAVVKREAEEAFRAAMASIAEVTRQDSFIVNYPDETPDNTTGEHDAAAQVRVKLDQPLTPSEQAELTHMFSSLGLGLTISNSEISTSNFSEEEISNENFYKLANYLLDGFNNGNAEATLHNARRVAENGNFSELAGIQEENAGDRQGRIWSGAIEHRTNYSTYYEARKGHYRDGSDRGTRQDYTDGKGNPAYGTTVEGRISATNLTPSTQKGRITRAYNESEDKTTLSPDFALSAPPISKGYQSLQQEVESIIDNAIAEAAEMGEAWDGSREELVESAAQLVRGMWSAATKQRGAQNQENAWLGVATYVEEARNACSNETERDVLDEIAARASEAYIKLTEKERAEIVEKYRRKNSGELRHLSASPVESLVYEAWRNQSRGGRYAHQKNSAEAIRERDHERRLKREAEREARRKAREAEREAKEAERAAKKAQQEAERKVKKANEISERDRIAKALLDKHGSVENYLENTVVHGRDGKPFMHSGKPLTLADYLKQKASVRSAIAGRYMTENNGESIKTVLDDLLGDANAALAYSDTRVNGNRARLTSNTKADALEAVLTAERAAQTTQHIKDGMAELGLPVEEEAKPDIDETIDEDTETNTETETETDTETETETDTETDEDTETETDEEQDAYEREREQERADEKADEEYLQQQEQEFEKAFSKSREGIEERIAFLEEKIDYDMATPEEEAELADLRKKVGKARNWDGVTPQFRTENQGKSHAQLTPAQRAATQAMLDMLDAAGIKTHFVSEAEIEAEAQKNQSENSARLMLQMLEQGTNEQSSNPIDGTKLQKNLEEAKQTYKNKQNARNSIISDIAKALGARNTGTSNYITIKAKNGTVFTLRLSNHNATVANFDNNGESNGISIVIAKHANNGINNNGNAHIVEFFYSDKALNKADGTPIADIIGALEQTMYSGEYSDPTGLAVRQEVNIPDQLQTAQFSIRTTPAPKKTGIGYKVFYRGKDGKLYPPMVANPNGADTPVGVWLDADAAPIAGESKTGRPQVKAGGKGTQGGSGQLAYRPGWHLGEIPYALQFNRKDAQGNRTLFPKEFVWAEVEYAADNNYQQEAEQEGYTENGKYRHSYAGLKHLPTDGFYRYRTNPNPETDPWIITGAMKVNRVLSNEEVDEMVRRAGRQPQQKQLLRTPQGVVYGYTQGGEIYLNSERLNANTPLHEYTHLWDTACKQKNPELWKRGVELMKQLPLWEEVKSDPNYSDLTTDDEIASEVHSRLSGKDGAALLEQLAQEAADMDAMEMTERLGLVGRLKKWLADFWHWTQDTFAPWTKSEAEQVSLDDFVRMPLADLARGVNPNEVLGREAKEASQSPLSNTQSSAQQETDASNSSAKVDENSESAKHAEWEKARFSIGQSNTPNERIAEITNELVRTLNGKGLKNKFFQIIEEIQNGYILLNKVFTNLNEARVASGKKALSVGQHLETIAAGTRGRAAGMLAVFDSYGHKKAYRNVLGSVGKAFRVEQQEAKERLDDYLMARSMLERIEEARQELANNGSSEELLYRLQKADEWGTAFADKYGMSAADYIAEFEGKVETKDLWKKINDATAYLREQAYSIGWISAEEKAKQDNRKYYVPNRNAAEVLGSEKRNEIKKELGLTDDAQVEQLINIYFRRQDGLSEAKVKQAIEDAGLADVDVTLGHLGTKPIKEWQQDLLWNRIDRLMPVELRGEDDFVRAGSRRTEGMDGVMTLHSAGRGSLAARPMENLEYMAKDAFNGISKAQLKLRLLELFEDEFNAKFLQNAGFDVIPEIEIDGELVQDASKVDEYHNMLDERQKQEKEVNAGLRSKIDDKIKDYFKRVKHNDMSSVPNSFLIEHNGVLHQIVVPNARVMDALRSDFGQEIRYLKTPKNILSRNVTTYNPGFATANFARDAEANLAWLAVENPEIAMRFANIIKTFSESQDVAYYLANGEFANTKQRSLFREFIERGGEGGYSFMLTNKLSFEHRTEAELTGGARDVLEKTKKWMSLPSNISEMLVRFAVYTAARESGLSADESLYYSKNSNINMDIRAAKRNGFTKVVYSVTPFLQPALTATALKLRKMFGDKDGVGMGKKGNANIYRWMGVAAAMTIAGIAKAYSEGDDDDDDVNALKELKYSDEDIEKYMAIKNDIRDSDYLTTMNYIIVGDKRIPLEQSLTIPWYIGYMGAQWQNGRITTGEFFKGAMTVIAQNALAIPTDAGTLSDPKELLPDERIKHEQFQRQNGDALTNAISEKVYRAAHADGTVAESGERDFFDMNPRFLKSFESWLQINGYAFPIVNYAIDSENSPFPLFTRYQYTTKEKTVKRNMDNWVWELNSWLDNADETLKRERNLNGESGAYYSKLNDILSTNELNRARKAIYEYHALDATHMGKGYGYMTRAEYENTFPEDAMQEKILQQGIFDDHILPLIVRLRELGEIKNPNLPKRKY